MKGKLYVFFGGLALFFQGGPPLAPVPSAQRKTGAPKESLRHEVTVNLKLVQVYVTDKKGNPAVDLKKRILLLFIDGSSFCSTGGAVLLENT